MNRNDSDNFYCGESEEVDKGTKQNYTVKCDPRRRYKKIELRIAKEKSEIKILNVWVFQSELCMYLYKFLHVCVKKI